MKCSGVGCVLFPTLQCFFFCFLSCSSGGGNHLYTIHKRGHTWRTASAECPTQTSKET